MLWMTLAAKGSGIESRTWNAISFVYVCICILKSTSFCVKKLMFIYTHIS